MRRTRLRDLIRDALKARAERPSEGAVGEQPPERVLDSTGSPAASRPAPPENHRIRDARYPRWSRGAPGDPPRPLRERIVETLEEAGVAPSWIEKLGLYAGYKAGRSYLSDVGEKLREEIEAMPNQTKSGKELVTLVGPTGRKVKLGAIGAAVTTLLVGLAIQYLGVPEEMGGQLAELIGQAIGVGGGTYLLAQQVRARREDLEVEK